MFISHLKDNPALQNDILSNPDNYYFQEKIDGSSVVFKIDNTGNLYVSRKLSKQHVSCFNVRAVESDLKNFSVCSLLTAYHILRRSIVDGGIDNMVPNKEYYAEYIDIYSTVSAVNYEPLFPKLTGFSSPIQVYFFIFDSEIVNGDLSGYVSSPRLDIRYRDDKMLVYPSLTASTYRVVGLPTYSFGDFIQRSHLNLIDLALTKTKMNSLFSEIEGMVILDKNQNPVSKVIPDYEKFTKSRKKNRLIYDFLKSAKKQNVINSAIHISEYCNKMARNSTPIALPSNSTINLFNRNLEYIYIMSTGEK